jgi:hypothetical protein
MNWLKVIGLGVIVWGIGLIWPQINQVLTPEVMAGAILGLGIMGLGQIWLRHQLQERPGGTGKTKNNHHSRPQNDSRPVKPLGLA